MTRDVAVLWQVIWILTKWPVAVVRECVDRTDGWLNFIDVFVGRAGGVYLSVQRISVSGRLHLHITALGALGQQQRRVFDSSVGVL